MGVCSIGRAGMFMETERICKKRTTCLIRGSDCLTPVIDLGRQNLASVFESPHNISSPAYLWQKYPLELVRCAALDGCGLVQLRHSIAPHVLYGHYGYRSGINESMRRNLKSIAQSAEKMVPLKLGDLVCDIGCNDGTLLAFFETPDIDRLGIDPAGNVLAYAREKGLDVIRDFFSQAVVETVRPGVSARIITTIAMFYDLEEPGQFVADVAALLAEDGLWVMEVAYLPTMLKNVSFDTICHEHLEYYCLRQIEWLLEPHGLSIYKVEMNDINGGSIRLFIRRKAVGAIPDGTAAKLARIREEELSLALDSNTPYREFYQAALTVRRRLQRLLHACHDRGRRIYVYGASTKGNTILQFCGLDHHLINKAVDRNPDKWGTCTPATGIKIISEEEARADPPDFYLVLPWPFFEVFRQREKAFLDNGGRFILPLPEVRVVGKNGDETAAFEK